MLKIVMLRSALIGCACALSITAHAYAADPLPISVPAGDLTIALEALAKQSGVELVYQSDQLKGLKTQGVTGTLPPEEAVVKLLEGTPLTLKTDSSGAMLITLPRATSDGIESKPTVQLEEVEATLGWWSRLRLAQADNTGQSRGSGDDERDDEQQAETSSEASAARSKGMPEILVKGSKILNMDIRRTVDDPQPYVIFDRKIIEQTGATNIGDFLKQRLPMNTQASLPSQINDINGNTSRINLRGLGTNQTLILIDGHRTPTLNGLGSPLQSDLHGIPLAAVERIEVLPTTASGIYGGSATGGVVNVVLRRDYSGWELKAAHGNTFENDAALREVSLSGGFSLEGGKTSIMLAGSYADSDDLLTRERDFARRGRDIILANNPAALLDAAVPPLGATTNIRSSDGSNLTLKDGGTMLNSPRTFVPVGYRGAALDGTAALVANAGRYDLGLADSAQTSFGESASRGGKQSLTNGPRIESLMATARREFGSKSNAFLELAASNNVGTFFDSNANGSFTLPATAPNNPFNQSINVQVPILQADAAIESRSSSRRAVGGVTWQLPRGWQAGVDYTWSQSRFSFTQPSGLAFTATGAIASGAVDVLRDPTLIDLSSFLTPMSRADPMESTLNHVTLRLAGRAGTLPAGDITVSGLLEHRDEDLAQGTLLLFPGPLELVVPDRSQIVDSVYVEVKTPLVAPHNNVPGVRELELQVAGRYDDYSVEGARSVISGTTTRVDRATNERSSTNPTIGLRYAPVGGLTLRASFGKGFLPPAVDQLVSSFTQQAGGIFTDPKRNGEQLLPFQQRSGGNPDLAPEESESISVGAIVQPTFVQGLRLSVDYTRIEKTDNITGFVGGVQGILNNEDLVPERVVRGPVPPNDPFGVGRVTSIDATLINLASANVEAYDIQLDLHGDTARWGAFDFFALATWQTHFETQLLPNAPEVENVGISFNFPLKLRANAGVTWTQRGWTLGWSSRYFDSYFTVDPAAALPGSLFASFLRSQGNGGRVPSQIYHDVFASYRFGAQADGWVSRVLEGAEVKLGVNNVFDERPPFDAAGRFYSPYGDPRLANYYLSLTAAF